MRDTAEFKNAAKQALVGRDFLQARHCLQSVLAHDRQDIASWLNLAIVERQLGNLDAAFLALREVLRIDPRSFLGLLMNASLLEQEGRQQAAANAYGIALAAAPPDAALDPPTLQAVQHARAVHAKHVATLNDFIRSEVADVRQQSSAPLQRRIDQFIGTTLRIRKRYQQQPMEYFYPGLPAIEFYDRELLPWLPAFESATQDIQRELATILRNEQRELAPYIHYDDYLPLDQWRELNHSPQWTAYHFYDGGEPIQSHWQSAPLTTAALALLPQARVPRRSPTALFSVLQPKTHIPPHTGVANFRLLVHLPLVLPPNCRFRVGGEVREWRLGEAWVFDDTIEHEAWNDSDQVRVIMICDIWNPYLSAEEQAAICTVLGAIDRYTGAKPATQF